MRLELSRKHLGVSVPHPEAHQGTHIAEHRCLEAGRHLIKILPGRDQRKPVFPCLRKNRLETVGGEIVCLVEYAGEVHPVLLGNRAATHINGGTMTAPVTECIFCGDPDPARLTWEHLWPRWSHKEIKRLMRKWHGVYGLHRIEELSVINADVRVTKRGGDVHDMQVRCVCGGDVRSCNNRWMRELENRARPVLIPLMNGHQLRLSPEQQAIVAGWAAMKAMVAEYERSARVTTTQSERDYMRTVRLPPDRGWAIWIGRYERKEWPGYLGSAPFVYWPEPERAHLLGVPTTDFNGQVSFQILKKLFIQIIRCQVPSLVEKWRFDARASVVLRKIWPPSGYSFMWPPPTMNDFDADYVTGAFSQAAITAIRRKLARIRETGGTPQPIVGRDRPDSGPVNSRA